jgi:hypothetical protein
MIGLVFFIVALTAFAFLADRFGVDSRPESTDPRSPAHPVGIS